MVIRLNWHRSVKVNLEHTHKGLRSLFEMFIAIILFELRML